MGTKYTAQSITGYNASPPADDGTQIESNKIKWATHKDKLTDPVKTLSEAINTALVTYVDRQPTLKSTNYTTTITDHLKMIETTGTTTITLGVVATMGTGYTVTVKNAGSGVVTVDGSGAETIDGQATVDLDPNQSITCVVDNAAGKYMVQSAVEFPTGTIMLFQQTTAPAGWTKETTHNDKALRVVTGTASSGGTTAFSGISALSGGSYTLLAADVPAHTHGSSGSHTHTVPVYTGGAGGSYQVGESANVATGMVTGGGTHQHTSFGGGGGHSHTLGLDMQYVDVIAAAKD